ncbi:class I SAM-dependent methyltransferase [Tautonia rosea]|uniref:class I SAM-dependent methyltransferase n=1 Tax=Tautonia rosea TaxID=2728037 RepID=UPI00147326A6|nr:class I SAM-dependent methyltransferase [Tautonia rosea]
MKYLPGPTVVPRNHLEETLNALPEGARILDVGAGGRRVLTKVVTLDAVPVKGVDVVGDIHRMPLGSDSFDCVICTGTLEHVQDPWIAVREIQRVLKPGGIAHIDVPFIQGYHADPTDYWRFTLDGLRFLCRGFEELDAGVHIGPSCGLVWIAREWADSCSGNRYLSNAMLIAAALVTAPIRYLDYLVIRSPRSHRVASAVFFRGQKPRNNA